MEQHIPGFTVIFIIHVVIIKIDWDVGICVGLKNHGLTWNNPPASTNRSKQNILPLTVNFDSKPRHKTPLKLILMNPILAYRLTIQPPRMSDQKEPSTVFVTLQVPNSTAVNYLQFSSEDARALEEVRAWLSTEYGPFGHSIGDRACAADLAFVMESPQARIYEPFRFSGGELIPDKFAPIPEDAYS